MKNSIFSLLFACVVAFSHLQAKAQSPIQTADEIWMGINMGWTGVYNDLLKYMDPNKSYIVWTMLAPVKPLDFRKPDNFRDFLAHNSSDGISISHNLVAWNCKLPNGDRYMGATGFSGESTGQSAKMVKSGFGLTTFLATFYDGWMSDSWQTAGIWEERSVKEDFHNLMVEVSPKDCANMIGFLNKFVHHPKKPFKKFGLRVNPEKFEGAGCISFASTLLSKAGILNKMFKASERTLWATHYAFGGNDLPLPENTSVPRLEWREGKQKKVGINYFFGNNWNATTLGVSLKLLDPELMTWGLKSMVPQMAAQPRKVQKYPGKDCAKDDAKCRGWSKVAIDDNFDPQAKKVSSLAKSWKAGMLSKGYKMKYTQLRGTPLIIFQKN